MKILYICKFSHPSICGVWNRVYNLSKEMIKRGHRVHIFSSNVTKGTGQISKPYEKFEGIHIHRFPVRLNIGSGDESAFFWKLKKDIIKLRPDIIDAQVYRHPHSTFIPWTARKIGARSVLTPHSPFVERGLRSTVMNSIIFVYDNALGRLSLKNYNEVLAIARWEIPYLLRLGCSKSKITYSPNGLAREFFISKPKIGDKNKILFLGRVAPIKNLEVLIHAIKILNDPTLKLEVVGPIEGKYGSKLFNLIAELGLKQQVVLRKPIYNLNEKIKTINSAGIFVLPSKREAMPQALIEAMSLGKIVISSDTQGGKEIVLDGKNGFLFHNGDEKDLAKKLSYCLKDFNKMGEIRKAAIKTTSELSWKKIAERIEKIYKDF